LILQNTVLAFNVPGNGFDGAVIENYLDFTARDIARIFIKGIQLLGLQNSTPLLEVL
jgi:homoserine O-acetyltransferase